MKNNKYTIDSDGNIHTVVQSNGFTGADWSRYKFAHGCMLHSTIATLKKYRLTSTDPRTEYRTIIYPGDKIVDVDQRKTRRILAHARSQKWTRPHWEVGCLLFQKFSEDMLKKMKLRYVIVMSEPMRSDLKELVSQRCFMGFDTMTESGYALITARTGFTRWKWPPGGGFAFIESKS